MIKNIQSNLSNWKDWYHTYHKEITLTSNVPVKNKKLYHELEQASQNYDGILTYAEYLQIEQFGTNGYYSTSDHHGKTDVDERWSLALAQYCLQNHHETIIEFGCGTSELGVLCCKEYKRLTNKKLTWIGVEIDKSIHKNIYEHFKNNNLSDCIGAVVTTLDQLPNLNNALIVFPYSLDNIPPHIFINTKQTDSYPDALLGIQIKKGMLSEMIVPQETLHKKGIKLQNGMFTHHELTCNLSRWNIRKGQRTYIATDAFMTLYQYAKKFTDATILIIDEFRNDPWNFGLGNIGIPKSLYEKNLSCNERERYYKESGRHNLYYPLYRNSLYKFLSRIGYRSITIDVEQKQAALLTNRAWLSVGKSYTTQAFTAKSFVDAKLSSLPIPSPVRKLV